MKKISVKLSVITLICIAILSFGFVGINYYMQCREENISSASEDANACKFSIVVPVYNTEKYLDECLNSLENQTFKDIEIICVNDGSKDNSLEILKNHAVKDERIKIIDKENGGVSSARNVGIDAASGTYISFVDSDDIMLDYTYEKVYRDFTRYNAEAVAFTFSQFEDGEDPDLKSYSYDESKVKIRTRNKNQNPFYHMADEIGYATTKVFKTSILKDNNLRFKEGMANYEDQLFNLFVFPHITRMVQDDNSFYLYRINRPGSAVTGVKSSKILKSTINGARELAARRNEFDFNDADDWLVTKIFDLTYRRITEDLENDEEKKFYASELIKIVEDEVVLKYNVKLVPWQQKNLDNLKRIVNS